MVMMNRPALLRARFQIVRMLRRDASTPSAGFATKCNFL